MAAISAVARALEGAPLHVAPAAEGPRPLYRETAPAEAYPIDALGPVLGPAARAIETLVQVPGAIAAQSVLGAAALAVQGHADVVLPIMGGSRSPLSLYLCTVAKSGDRKSGADGQALKPVREHEARLIERHDAELPDAENDHRAWKKAAEEVEKRGKGDRAAIKAGLDMLGPEPRKPLLGEIICPEPNWQGLMRLFDEGQPSLGLFSAEGGGFLGGHGMNPENRTRTVTGLSELWDGSTVKRIRAGGIGSLPGRRLSVHLMVQPGKIADMLLADPLLQEQGTLARMLVVKPASIAGSRPWQEPPEEALSALRHYGRHMTSMLRALLPMVVGKRNQLAPRELPLSAAAKNLWTSMSTRIDFECRKGGHFESISAFASKAAENAARIAGVLTLVRNLSAEEIDLDHMFFGKTLMEHYLTEALRIEGDSAVDATLDKAKRLSDWLRENWNDDRISVTEIVQSGPATLRSSKEARPIVKILVENGHLEAAGNGTVRGVSRRETYRIVRG
jgi:hypothetical protein